MSPTSYQAAPPRATSGCPNWAQSSLDLPQGQDHPTTARSRGKYMRSRASTAALRTRSDARAPRWSGPPANYSRTLTFRSSTFLEYLATPLPAPAEVEHDHGTSLTKSGRTSAGLGSPSAPATTRSPGASCMSPRATCPTAQARSSSFSLPRIPMRPCSAHGSRAQRPPSDRYVRFTG
jgi:hypothetical protein